MIRTRADSTEQGTCVREFGNPIERLAQQAFGETADPAEYVPREATEQVLGRLEASVLGSGIPAALIAAPGMGKTLLLRVFAQRARRLSDVAELAYGSLGFEDLCEWSLGLLGVRFAPSEGLASDALLRAAERRDITLVIDDASSLPTETAHQLGDLLRCGTPKLRLALAAADGYASSHVLAAIGAPLEELRLRAPMTPDETRIYMQRRLSRAAAPSELRDKLGNGVLSRVLRLSGGIPRRVHAVVHEVVVDLPADVRAAWRDEDWIGAPLDELGGLGDAARSVPAMEEIA